MSNKNEEFNPKSTKMDFPKPEKKSIYHMCINNIARYIQSQDREVPGTLTAFSVSEVLAIAFCKDEADIMMDILKANFQSPFHQGSD